MLVAAARADKSRFFCCESDFKIVSPASSVSLAVLCARSNVSERLSALETEFTSASRRSSSLSTAKEFLPPPPPPLDSTSKFPRDDDFSNCARVRERERERRVSLEDGPPGTPTTFERFSNHLRLTLKRLYARRKKQSENKNRLLSAVSKTKGRCALCCGRKGKNIYIARTGAVSSSPRPPPPLTGTIFVARFVVVVGVCLW